MVDSVMGDVRINEDAVRTRTDHTALRATVDGPFGTVAEHTESVDVFFDDLDAFGMMYHGRFAALLERAITLSFARLGLTLGHPDLNVVVRELHLVFERPIRGIGPLDVTFGLEKLGRTSASFAFRVHCGEVTHAHGQRVIIKIDPRTGAPEAWPQPTRQLLRRMLPTSRRERSGPCLPHGPDPGHPAVRDATPAPGGARTAGASCAPAATG
ncbi:acyl-CoA thioesterase [Streptomyces sp. NPDC058914]|uniref:acyl-CoA thioesterase n=1 Tax=Streptomyces TaxID=1883 RepID=UPI003676E8BD